MFIVCGIIQVAFYDFLKSADHLYVIADAVGFHVA